MINYIRIPIELQFPLKYCPECELVLERSEFYPCSVTRDQLQGWCKKCQAGLQELPSTEKQPDKPSRARREITPDERMAALKRRVKENQLRSNNGIFTIDDLVSMLEKQKGACSYCGEDISVEFEIEHQVPLSRGGSNTPDNIVLSCCPCNASKGNKLLTEWKGRSY